jgi:hypothetical protein
MALGWTDSIDEGGPSDPAPSTSQDQLIAELKARGWSDEQIQAYLTTGGTPENPIEMGPEDPSVGNPGAFDLPSLPPEPPATTPAVTPPATTTPGTGGGGSSGPPAGAYDFGTDYGYGADSPFGAWSGHFDAPEAQPLPDFPYWDPTAEVPDAPVFNAPVYTPPPAFSYEDFVGPSIEEAMASPGYQFRLGQGSDRLQNAASARGTLNDSGTLKALMDYGQEAASQEYGNVWNRAINTYGTNRGNAVENYNTNYKTQFIDPYTASYQAAKDQFAPRMTQYQGILASGRDLNQARMLGYTTDAANIQHLNDTTNTNAWNDYSLGWQDFQNRRNLGADFALRS